MLHMSSSLKIISQPVRTGKIKQTWHIALSLLSEETKKTKRIKKAKAKCPESLDGLMNYEI